MYIRQSRSGAEFCLKNRPQDHYARPGDDFMKPMRPKFTDKTYLVKYKYVIVTTYGFKALLNPRLLSTTRR
jgi:hypothetical protein